MGYGTIIFETWKIDKRQSRWRTIMNGYPGAEVRGEDVDKEKTNAAKNR